MSARNAPILKVVKNRLETHNAKRRERYGWKQDLPYSLYRNLIWFKRALGYYSVDSTTLLSAASGKGLS
ncbi:MAG TPA: hypothetical protein ENI07_10345 [Desulfobacterales bacterium]|nr:hypothetical protein [Desulfobacterales bacterium]